jgi:hypothetical protein
MTRVNAGAGAFPFMFFGSKAYLDFTSIQFNVCPHPKPFAILHSAIPAVSGGNVRTSG